MSDAAVHVRARPAPTPAATPTGSDVGVRWKPCTWETISESAPRKMAAQRPAAQPAPPPQAAVDPAELEAIRAQARTQAAAEGRREGLAQGYDEGYRAGMQAGQAAVDAQAAQLLAVMQALPQALQRVESEMSMTLTELALAIARRIVHRSFEAQPQWIMPLVQDLLHVEPALQGQPQLLMHPLDAQLVHAKLGPELAAAGWQIRHDESIARGGCIVNAASGTHDATVETRWARVEAALAREPH